MQEPCSKAIGSYQIRLRFAAPLEHDGPENSQHKLIVIVCVTADQA